MNVEPIGDEVEVKTMSAPRGGCASWEFRQGRWALSLWSCALSIFATLPDDLLFLSLALDAEVLTAASDHLLLNSFSTYGGVDHRGCITWYSLAGLAFVARHSYIGRARGIPPKEYPRKNTPEGIQP